MYLFDAFGWFLFKNKARNFEKGGGRANMVRYGRHGVKVGPGPRDPGPPSKFKSGTRESPKV